MSKRGTCNSADGNCECTDFYTGDRCADELRSTYIGTYAGSITLAIAGSSNTESRDFAVEKNGSSVQNLKIEIDTSANTYIYIRLDDATSRYTVTGDNDPAFDWTGSGTINSTSMTANLATTSFLGAISVSVTGTKK
ncbi:hypothetical protein KFE98_17880 [bacterium SCSIO 12741]|nr:hypothetical protein KFE98_17880 [bacterium SCSIO 12741]